MDTDTNPLVEVENGMKTNGMKANCPECDSPAAGSDNLESAIAADVETYRRDNESATMAALAAGRKLALAKLDARHGEWLPLLERVGLEPRTAQRWMRMADAVDNDVVECDTVTYLGIRSTLSALSALDALDPDSKWRYPGILDELDETGAPDTRSAVAARVLISRLMMWMHGETTDKEMGEAFKTMTYHYGGFTDPATKKYIGDWLAARNVFMGLLGETDPSTRGWHEKCFHLLRMDARRASR